MTLGLRLFFFDFVADEEEEAVEAARLAPLSFWFVCRSLAI